jgi:hypothetical protein
VKLKVGETESDGCMMREGWSKEILYKVKVFAWSVEVGESESRKWCIQ